MEALKELKQALKTWEHQFFKENGRKPNREDIGLASDKVQSAYSRYNKLKVQLGQLTTASKSQSGDVWGQDLNRTFDQKKDPKTPDVPTNKKEEVKKMNFLEKLSSKLFISSKKCDALKKLTRHRSLSGAASFEESKSSIDSEGINFQDSKDGSFLNHSVDSIPSQDVTASRCDNSCEPSTPKRLSSLSNDTSFPVVSSCLFKKTLNISTPLRSLKVKKPFELVSPDVFQHKQNHKFSISSSFSLEGGEDTNNPYSGFEFYATPSKDSFSSLDSNNMEKSGVFVDNDSFSSITLKRNISQPNEEDKLNVSESISSYNKSSPSSDAYECNPSRWKMNGKSTDCSNEERLLPLQNLGMDKRTEEDFDLKNHNVCDYQISQRKKRMLSPDKESLVGAKRAKQKEISCDDLGDTEDPAPEGSSADNSVNKKDKQSLSKMLKSEDNDDSDNASPKRLKKTQMSIKTSAPPKASQINKSENFVRLNMKVKRFSKKGQRVKGAIYKRQQWKKKQRDRQKSYGDKCFRCGQSGHWASKCTNAAANVGTEKFGYKYVTTGKCFCG